MAPTFLKGLLIVMLPVMGAVCLKGLLIVALPVMGGGKPMMEWHSLSQEGWAQKTGCLFGAVWRTAGDVICSLPPPLSQWQQWCKGLGLPVMGNAQQAESAPPTPVVPVRGPEDNTGDGMTSKDAGGATSGDSSSAMVSSLPFILSEGLAPVPTKLVARIHRDEFVDMADLLLDNLEARRQGDLLEATSSTMEPKRNRREVLDLLSWVQCFGTSLP